MPQIIPFHDSIDRVNAEDFLANEIRSVFLSSVAALAFNTVAPHFSGLGTTDLSTFEVSGGNFPANGFIHTGKTATGDPLLLNVADLAQVAQDALNPNNIRYEMLVDFTRPDRLCYGFYDYGTDQDASAGPRNLEYALGIWTVKGNEVSV